MSKHRLSRINTPEYQQEMQELDLAKSRHTYSPKAHTSIQTLKEIKENRYQGKTGKEYDPHETDQAINEAHDRKAARQKKFPEVESDKNRSTFSEMVPPPLKKAPYQLSDSISTEMGQQEINTPNSNDKFKIYRNKQLPDGLHLQSFVKQTEDGPLKSHYLMDTDNKTPLAKLHTEAHPYDDEIRNQVKSAQVAPGNEGEGYGKRLYLEALKHEGSLHSDESVSQKAHGVWQWLSKQPGIDIKFGSPNSAEIHQAKIIKPVKKSEDEEDLEKAMPRHSGEFHPSQPWVSKFHPNGVLMWHANPGQQKHIDSHINNPEVIQKFMSKIPDTHKALMNGIIKMTQNDPNRHFIPSNEGGKDKLRARHLKGLLLGDNGINIDTSTPNKITITRDSHSQGLNAGKSVVMNFNGVTNVKKTIDDDRRGLSGDLPSLLLGTRPGGDVHSRGSGLYKDESEPTIERHSDNGAGRPTGDGINNFEVDITPEWQKLYGMAPNEPTQLSLTNPVTVNVLDYLRDRMVANGDLIFHPHHGYILNQKLRDLGDGLTMYKSEKGINLLYYSKTPDLTTIVPHGDYSQMILKSSAPINGAEIYKSKYRIEIPQETKLYDLGLDGDDVIEGVLKMNAGKWDEKNILDFLKNEGYEGFYCRVDIHTIVCLFHPVPVKMEEVL